MTLFSLFEVKFWVMLKGVPWLVPVLYTRVQILQVVLQYWERLFVSFIGMVGLEYMFLVEVNSWDLLLFGGWALVLNIFIIFIVSLDRECCFQIGCLSRWDEPIHEDWSLGRSLTTSLFRHSEVIILEFYACQQLTEGILHFIHSLLLDLHCLARSLWSWRWS